MIILICPSSHCHLGTRETLPRPCMWRLCCGLCLLFPHVVSFCGLIQPSCVCMACPPGLSPLPDPLLHSLPLKKASETSSFRECTLRVFSYLDDKRLGWEWGFGNGDSLPISRPFIPAQPRSLEKGQALSSLPSEQTKFSSEWYF